MFFLFFITVYARRVHLQTLGGGITPPDAPRISSVQVVLKQSAVFAVPLWLDGMESMWLLMEKPSKTDAAVLVCLCRKQMKIFRSSN